MISATTSSTSSTPSAGATGTPPAPGPQVRLQVSHVSKRFTLHLRGGLQLPVLDDVSLSVHAGECVALVGPSGRGKSTLIKCLHGSYGVDAGAIWLRTAEGLVDIARANARQMLALRRRDLGYVSQFLRALPRVPAVDVVAERVLDAQDDPRSPLDDEAYEARRVIARRLARSLFARLNLPEALWDLPPATFSGGEQQRVNIARGFVHRSGVLLLDEPTASLDAENRKVVMQLIQEAKAEGTAIVGIFHDEEVRDTVATRCVVLDAAAAAAPAAMPA